MRGRFNITGSCSSDRNYTRDGMMIICGNEERK